MWSSRKCQRTIEALSNKRNRSCDHGFCKFGIRNGKALTTNGHESTQRGAAATKPKQPRMTRIDTDSLAVKERKGTQRILTTDGHGWARMNRRKQREQSLETLHFPGLLHGEAEGGRKCRSPNLCRKCADLDHCSTRFFRDSARKKRFACRRTAGCAISGFMPTPDDFSTYLADLLSGTYDCVDRISLRGYYPMGQTSGINPR